MKKILGIIILGLTLLVGCVPMDYTPIIPVTIPETTAPTSTRTIQPTKPPVSGNYGDIGTDYVNYVAVGSFGVYGSLTINNYQTGVTVDKNIKGYQPLYIINRTNKVSEKKTIITDKGEIIADIPIRRLLHESDIKNVVSVTNEVVNKYVDPGAAEKVLIATGNALTPLATDSSTPVSSLTIDNAQIVTETLTVVKYNPGTSTLTISGFAPNALRVVVITYIPDSEYTLSSTTSVTNEMGYSQAPPEVVNWVSFDADTILISPESYAPVWVTLSIPEGTDVKPIQIWQLTSTGKDKVDKVKTKILELQSIVGKTAEQITKDRAELATYSQLPENKLLLSWNDFTKTEYATKAAADKAVDEIKDKGYIALSNTDKWEFYVVISLYSGKQATGIGAAIEYNVGIKVDMG